MSNGNNAAAYDQWRVNYPMTTTAEHAAIYDASYEKDPQHASFAGRAVRVFLNQAGGNPVIAEVGGRNGALAKVALEFTPSIKRWINYEICGAAITGNVAHDPRYEAKLMTDFRWWTKTRIEGDILIASHFIEHISDDDFRSFVRSIPGNIKGIHAQSPLPLRGPMDWNGYKGAHMLTLGWLEVDEEFSKNGFKTVVAYDGASWFRR